MTSNVCAFLCGAAAGAAVMYFLDPQGGRRRRSQMRDQATSLAGRAGDYAEKAARDLSNRAAGAAHEARQAAGV